LIPRVDGYQSDRTGLSDMYVASRGRSRLKVCDDMGDVTKPLSLFPTTRMGEDDQFYEYEAGSSR
jgi:hypothetical protein